MLDILRKERVTCSFFFFIQCSFAMPNVSDQFIFNGSIGGKKHGRGSLKGFSAAMKRIKTGTQKLHIEFSVTKGGPIGPNARAFVDEVVSCSRKRAPLIGVRSWRDIHQKVKNSIVTDVTVCTMICFAKYITF